MNRNRLTRQFECTGMLLLLVLSGCDSAAPPPPALEQLETMLSVSFPKDCRVIGGTEASESALWLIVSSKPLPLPTAEAPRMPRRPKQGERPEGTPFPIAALLNLMAACEVSQDELPKLSAERGFSHSGKVGDRRYSYREAATQQGYLTAVEIFSTRLSETPSITND